MPDMVIVDAGIAIADAPVDPLQLQPETAERFVPAGSALDHRRHDSADLPVLDAGLPDTGGFDAWRSLRARCRPARFPSPPDSAR